MSDSIDAIRAAAQCAAAKFEGCLIQGISRRGIELGDCDGRPRRATVLAEIAVGMAGIVAVDRWRFGVPPRGSAGATVSFYFTQDQLNDFDQIRELIEEIDPTGDQDVLLMAWQNACDLISSDTIWAAVERFASLLDEVDLDEIDELTSLNI